MPVLASVFDAKESTKATETTVGIRISGEENGDVQ